MSDESAPDAEAQRRRQAKAAWAAYRDPRVWGAYLAQTVVFILLFFVWFPTAQPRLLLILAYALPSAALAGWVHKKVTRERLDTSSSARAS